MISDNNKLREIKKQELDFVKRQEGNLDNKINIVVTVVGFFVTIVGAVLFSNYQNFGKVIKVSFSMYVLISLIMCLLIIFPKIVNKKKIKNNKRFMFYSKDYEGMNEQNYLDYLDFQISLSINIFNTRIKWIRCLIVVEICLLLIVITLFLVFR